MRFGAISGVGSLWVLCNLSYAGMRAQDQRGLWRTVAFVGGLPQTLLTFVAVDEGSERAFGVDLVHTHVLFLCLCCYV